MFHFIKKAFFTFHIIFLFECYFLIISIKFKFISLCWRWCLCCRMWMFLRSPENSFFFLMQNYQNHRRNTSNLEKYCSNISFCQLLIYILIQIKNIIFHIIEPFWKICDREETVMFKFNLLEYTRIDKSKWNFTIVENEDIMFFIF